MTNSKFKLFVLMLSGTLLYAACRKMDQQTEPGNPKKLTAVTDKFFTVPINANSQIKAIAQIIFKQNEKNPFVDKLVKKIGYPHWDKGFVATSAGIARGGGTTTESLNDSTSIIYLPFAVPDSNTTSAVLVIKEIPADTSYNLVYPQHYQQYGFDTTASGWNARNVFSMFAEFDYNLFGNTTFKITDGRIFGGTSDDTLTLKRQTITGNSVPQPDDITWVQVCTVYTIIPPAQQRVLNTDALMGSGSYAICTGYWVVSGTGSGGGSGGGGGTGGGGGSGGGTTWPNQPPCPPQQRGVNTIEVVTPNPCGTGWVVITVNNPPPLAEPIDSLLRKNAEVANRFRDSLSSLCETQHKERFFNIVNYNNQLDTFRVLTGLSDDEVKPNYYMTGGRVLKGSWHYHPKYSDGTPGSWPSGGDVTQLYDKPNGFVMIIDTYNARYALVLEDVSKMIAWKNIIGNGPAMLPEKVANSVYGDPRAYSTGPTYIQMTKEKILAALGISSTCGIGLYEAPSSSGTTFTKIN